MFASGQRRFATDAFWHVFAMFMAPLLTPFVTATFTATNRSHVRDAMPPPRKARLAAISTHEQADSPILIVTTGGGHPCAAPAP
jgi:hypothetical protein